LKPLKLSISCLSLATVVAQGVLVSHLFRSGVARRYPVLTYWIAFEAVTSFALLFLWDHSRWYIAVWQPVAVAEAFLGFAVVWEAFSVRARPYGGIKAFGRGLLVMAFLIGVALTLVPVAAEWSHLNWQSKMMIPTTLSTTVDFVISIFMIVAALVFRVFRENKSPKNDLVIFRTLLIYFFGTGIGFFAGNITGETEYPLVNLWNLIISFGTAATLLILVTKAGETRVDPPSADAEESARLEVLDAL
jgi:hypothetical protein